MKIENIESIRVSIPFETGGKRQGMRPGLTPWLKMESFKVRVETDDGFSGWGDGFGHFVNPATEAAMPDSPGLGFEPDWQALEPHVVSRQQVQASR